MNLPDERQRRFNCLWNEWFPRLRLWLRSFFRLSAEDVEEIAQDALFAAGVLSFGGKIAYIADLPSALFILILPLCMLRAGWTFREMGAAFKAALTDGAEKTAAQKAALFFAQLQRYLLLTGLLCFMVGLMAILCNLENPAALGANIAVSLISCLYAILLCLAVAVPLKNAALRQRREREGDAENGSGSVENGAAF